MRYVGSGLWDVGFSHLPQTVFHFPPTTERLLNR